MGENLNPTEENGLNTHAKISVDMCYYDGLQCFNADVT